MQFLDKNVATGVCIDLQLWAQCLLATAWISMSTVTRRMQTQLPLPVRRSAGMASYHWLCAEHSTGFNLPKVRLGNSKFLG